MRKNPYPAPLVPLPSFLNKLLGMRLEDQELLFSYFAASMDKASTCNGIRLAQLHASGLLRVGATTPCMSQTSRGVPNSPATKHCPHCKQVISSYRALG